MGPKPTIAIGAVMGTVACEWSICLPFFGERIATCGLQYLPFLSGIVMWAALNEHWHMSAMALITISFMQGHSQLWTDMVRSISNQNNRLKHFYSDYL
jgi:hypothetical protein